MQMMFVMMIPSLLLFSFSQLSNAATDDQQFPSFHSDTNSTNATTDHPQEGEMDQISMGTLLLLLIPSLIGFSLSFALVKRSFFPSRSTLTDKKPPDLLKKSYYEVEMLDLKKEVNFNPISKTISSSSSDQEDSMVSIHLGQVLKNSKKGEASASKKTFMDWLGIKDDPEGEGSDSSSTHTNTLSTCSIDLEEQATTPPHPPSIPSTGEEQTMTRMQAFLSLLGLHIPRPLPSQIINGEGKGSSAMVMGTERKNCKRIDGPVMYVDVLREDDNNDRFLEMTIATPLEEEEVNQQITYNLRV